MECPIKFDTIKSGWSIVYIEGTQVITSKMNLFLSLKIDFVLATSSVHDEMGQWSSTHAVLKHNCIY